VSVVDGVAAPLVIKICGVTTLEDARLTLALGADAVGINLIPSSKRAVPLEEALKIFHALDQPESVVFVVADLLESELRILRKRVGSAWLQLHGSEAESALQSMLPRAYKAVPIGSAADAASAALWPGERLLVDAKVGAAFGGTGAVFDWSLVTALASKRRLIVAGGLHAENVAQAINTVRPFGVDVASGVEVKGLPRTKDPARIERFIQAARQAAGLAAIL